MKGISAAFSRTSAFVNRRNCAEDNAVWSLFSCLFVKDIMPKLMMLSWKLDVIDLEGQTET